MTLKTFPYFLVAYVLSIALLNIGFSYVPMIDIGFGLFSPMAVFAGTIFVTRDFAQREVGHFVLFGMAAGAVLSFVMADPFVAWASVIAFACSEIGDWLIYTVTKKPFHQRIWLSSLISTPVDTAVFLYLINGMTVGTFVLMVFAKLIAAAVIWWFYHMRGGSSYDKDYRAARYGA